MDRIAFARRLIAAIDADIAAMTETIVAGKPGDYADYRAATGRRQGLVAARAHATTLLGTDRRELD